MYDKNPNKETLAEEILCELLQFLQFKIRNHKLTVADSEAIHRIFDGIDITGTADDFAKFYGQHPVTVRSVICRKYIGKPRRARRGFPFFYLIKDNCTAMPAALLKFAKSGGIHDGRNADDAHVGQCVHRHSRRPGRL